MIKSGIWSCETEEETINPVYPLPFPFSPSNINILCLTSNECVENLQMGRKRKKKKKKLGKKKGGRKEDPPPQKITKRKKKHVNAKRIKFLIANRMFFSRTIIEKIPKFHKFVVLFNCITDNI